MILNAKSVQYVQFDWSEIKQLIAAKNIHFTCKLIVISCMTKYEESEWSKPKKKKKIKINIEAYGMVQMAFSVLTKMSRL